MQPRTHYARSGDVHIAYQVVGDGPVDLVYVPGWVSHVEYAWENPGFARTLRRLASFSRLILFDKRGTGMSDRVPDTALPTLEERMDDVRAVMDAVSSERAFLFGVSEGGPMALLFAATYPDRVAGLITYASYPRRSWAPDYPVGLTVEEQQVFFDDVEMNWGGDGLDDIDIRAPSIRDDPHARNWMSMYGRIAASPGAALTLLRMNFQIDVRDVLPTIRVPTLILHRVGDQRVSVENSRYMAAHMPGAKYVGLPGVDHSPTVGDTTAIVDEIEEFVTGERHAVEPDRVLATVLFTDIVGSTERALTLGDHRWRELLEDHDRLVRSHLERARGRAVKHTGDGFLATFDGPARAVRCARAISDAVRQLGIEIRAGLHTGECELIGDDVGGIAVHIGQRVSALAGPNEVLVSSTVKDLVVGSGIEFEDQGAHALKGLPDVWRIFRVAS
jgi:class 3 adenylate cyclase/alpha-beta hydrolase superfamily lysophospholipase